MREQVEKLRSDLADVLTGQDLDEAIVALGTVLTQAMAESARDLEAAQFHVDRLATAMKLNIVQNWHLVEARRRKQMQ